MTTIEDREYKRRERIAARAQLRGWARGMCAHAIREAQRDSLAEAVVRRVRHADFLAFEATTLARVLTVEALKNKGRR